MKIFLLFVLFLSNAAVFAQDVSESYRVLDARFYTKLKKAYPFLTFDHLSTAGFEVFGPNGLSRLLAKEGVPYIQDEAHPLIDEYPSPEAIESKVDTWVSKYPNLIQKIVIGKSGQGRNLFFVRFLGRVKAPKPEFKYIANMHGDEIAGRELMMYLIEDFVLNYEKNSVFTQLVDSIDIYIMPSMNPDGAVARKRGNAQNVDLNRSFPDFTTADRTNTFQKRPVETQAIMKFQAQHQFKLSANFHGGAEVVNYPWDTTAEKHPLENFVVLISQDYANQVPYLRNSTEFQGGIVNGYQWYEVDGGMQDWSYYWHRDLQVTIELTNRKWPAYSELKRVYEQNRSALLSYIRQTLKM